MRTIMKHLSHIIIRPGDVFTYKNNDYEVAYGTSEILGGGYGTINLTDIVWRLRNIETGEIIEVPERTLKKELPKYNKVIDISKR